MSWLETLSKMSTSLLFRVITITTVIIPSRALSRVLESINELHMIPGEDLTEISIDNIDHDSLHTTGIKYGIW